MCLNFKPFLKRVLTSLLPDCVEELLHSQMLFEKIFDIFALAKREGYVTYVFRIDILFNTAVLPLGI